MNTAQLWLAIPALCFGLGAIAFGSASTSDDFRSACEDAAAGCVLWVVAIVVAGLHYL